MYSFQSHTADIKIRFEVKDFKDIFKEGINALNSFLEPKLKDKELEKEIEVNSIDEATLFVDYLNELIAIIQTEKIFPVEIKIKNLDNQNLKASVLFKKYDKIIKDIKAATYHNLNLIKKDKIILEVVLDV